METKVYHTEHDKLEKWGEGPWVDEPDKVQWPDKETGLPCLAKRNSAGVWCGYVGVSPDHPLYGAHYDTPNVYVHGGLTYSAPCSHGDESKSICHVPGDGEPDNIWWFGFDCCHAGDFAPGLNHHKFEALQIGAPTGWGETIQYRNLEYVQDECRKLAESLVEMKNNWGMTREDQKNNLNLAMEKLKTFNKSFKESFASAKRKESDNV